MIVKVPDYEWYNDYVVLVRFLTGQIYVGEDLKVKIILYHIGSMYYINVICNKISCTNKTLRTSSNDGY